MDLNDPISVRLSKLNSQLVTTKTLENNFNTLNREGLLDAFNVLYEECNTDFLKKHDHQIAGFVEKHRNTLKAVRCLRVNVSDFEIKNVIGRGHFGEVHIVSEKQTGDIYAMKTIKKSDCLKMNTASFEVERNIMACTGSVWLTSLQYAFQDNSNLYFIMEYHPGGDLLGLLHRQGGTIPESAASFYIAELVVALNDLHTMGYVHRDIKPDNILLDRCGHIKLADFGSAAKLNSKGFVGDPMPVGTPEYIAPEVLQCNDNKNNKKTCYGISCDYWSVGVLAFQMTVGNTPFSGPNTPGTYTKIMNYKVNLKFPPDIVLSQAYVLFVKNLIADPNSRLNYEQMLKHPVFQNIDFNSLRDQVPPYVPKINSVDDVSNFFDIPKKKNQPNIENFKTKTQFSGKQLPFIGFSYTFESCDYQRSVSQHMIKNENVEELRKEIDKLQKQLVLNKDCFQEKETFEKKLEDQTRHLESAENLRNRLEHDLANSFSECSALKRRLDLERKDRADLEHKALELIKSAKLKWEVSEKTKLDALNLELSQQLDKVHQLTATNSMLNEQLQHALKLENKQKTSFENIQQLNRRSIVGLESRLDKITTEKQNTISDLQTKLAEEINAKKMLEIKTKSLESAQTSLLDKLQLAENNFNDNLIKLQDNHQLIKDLENKIIVLEESSKVVEAHKEKAYQLEQELIKVQNEHVVENLEKELKKEKDNCSSLQQQLQEFKDEFNAVTAEKETSLKDTSDYYTKHIEDLKEKLTQAVEEKNLLELNLQESKATELTNKLKLQTLEDLLKRLESGVNKLETDCDKENVLKEQIERLEKQLIEVHESSVLGKEELSRLKTKYWRMEKDLNNADIDKRILKREIKEIEEKNAQMILQIEELKLSLSENTKIHETAFLELNGLNENLGNEIIKLKDLNKSLENKLECERTKCSDVNATITELHRNINMKDDTITTMLKDLEIAQSERQELNQQIIVLEREKSNMQQLAETSNKDKDRMNNDLQNCEQELRNTKLNLDALREACTLLENQLIEYENIHASYESQQKSLKANTEKLIVDLAQAKEEIQQTKKLVNEERSLKLMGETRCKRLTEDIECLKNECSSYKQQCIDFRNYSSTLTDELSAVEEKVSDNEVTIKSYQRQISNLVGENNILKEENSAQLTHLHKVKESNYQLGKQLSDSKKSIILLHESLNELQDALTQKENFCKERELKSSSTIQQQTKLIDFLQFKIEEFKKKKTLSDKLFGHSRKENLPPTPVALSYKDMENLLSKEKEMNKELRAEITKLKYESSGTNDCNYRSVEQNSKVISPKTKLALEQLTMSPCTQRNDLYRNNSLQRMYHNIPHRYDSKLCTKITKCTHCNNNIPLGRVMKYCTDCNILVHVACAKFLPKTCGVPKAYVKHYSENVSKMAHNELGENKLQNDVLPEDINIEGWVRIPVRGNTGWEKQYACLTSSSLKIYAQPPNDTNISPIEVFDLLPPDGYGSVILDPVASEIYAPLAKSDLPFIIKVEVHPNTTCWPPKSITVMTLSSEDKEKWSKALLSILQKPEIKYCGEVVMKHGEDLDINCLVELDTSTKLLGTEQGLYSYSNDTLLRIAGPISVHQISILPTANLAVMIVDTSRYLITCDLNHLLSLTKCAACTKPTLKFQFVNINNLEGFHLFKVSDFVKHFKLCVATTKQMIIMNYESYEFIPVRILDTAEPTSCMLFTEHSLIVGANKFFEIDLMNFEADEFLDVSDSKLNQAIMCYRVGSFPLDIMQISNDPIEYLLCFHEFGVFVDEFGRCSRVTDIKWSRLPRAFYFYAPYLYIVQFFCVEIVKIVSDTCNLMKNSVDSLLNVESNKVDVDNVKYLGASSLGGVYIDTNGEIKLVKGRRTDPDSLSLSSTSNEPSECSANINEVSDEFSFTSSMVHSLEGNSSDTEADSPDSNDVVCGFKQKKVTFNSKTTEC